MVEILEAFVLSQTTPHAVVFFGLRSVLSPICPQLKGPSTVRPQGLFPWASILQVALKAHAQIESPDGLENLRENRASSVQNRLNPMDFIL